MNTKKSEVNDTLGVSSRSEETLINEKGTVPGQQIGLYSNCLLYTSDAADE